jgi:hypothetical protein
MEGAPLRVPETVEELNDWADRNRSLETILDAAHTVADMQAPSVMRILSRRGSYVEAMAVHKLVAAREEHRDQQPAAARKVTDGESAADSARSAD